MKRALFLSTLAFTLISGSQAGDRVDVSSLTPEERLRRCIKLLHPDDLRNISLFDYKDPQLRSEIMILQHWGHSGPNRWNPSSLLNFMGDQFSLSGRRFPLALRRLESSQLGWRFSQLEILDKTTALIHVRHANGATKSLHIPWDPLLHLHESAMLSHKVVLKQTPEPDLRQAEKRAAHARAGHDRTETMKRELSLKMYRQTVRAVEFLPEYFASVVARAADLRVPMSELDFVQKVYYDLLNQDEVISLLKTGDLLTYSARSFAGSHSMALPSTGHLRSHLVQSFDERPGENRFHLHPHRGKESYSLDPGTELMFFLNELRKALEDSQNYAYSLMIHREPMIELHYVDYGKLMAKRKSAEENLREVEIRRQSFTPAQLESLRFVPSALAEGTPETIRSYVGPRYCSSLAGAGVQEEHLTTMLQFMKDAENRTEYFNLYLGRGEDRKLGGTLSLVTSKGVHEDLASERINPGLIVERLEGQDTIEISRFTMDFGTRRHFSSSEFLKVAYYLAGSRKVGKIIAFCEKKFAEEVMANSAFKATNTSLLFEGQPHYLLEVDPRELLEYAISQGS